MFDPKDVMFTEKYRPKKISEVVGDFKDKILKYLKNPNSMPHILLYSSTPGTGKTSLSKAIINELGCDKLILNSSDDRKIEVIREKVKQFAITKSSKLNMRRCVFLDEFDGMLKASQEALRNLMETYASNVFFILTCNSIEKVINPLQSRCLKIPFAYPKKEEIYKYLEMICKKENMKYDEEGIKKLIEVNYPSIRNAVVALQDLKTMEKDIIVDNIIITNQLFEEMWNYLKEKKWYEIKKQVMSTTINPQELNKYFWNKAINEENINTKLIQLCCRNEKDIAWGADSKIIVVTSLLEMMK